MTADPATDRDVLLRDGRRIVVRGACRDDDAGLMALYDTFDDDDRYRRFFGFRHPPPEFFTDLATVAERGGARLVAVLSGPAPAEDRIIGEAGYVLIPNGDGELAMTVARGWRGWLGPYLLDALVEHAAAAGVPNLEADVLAVNGPMLAVLRARGSVVMEHEDASVVRLLIGTASRMPAWPGHHDRTRVLVEGTSRWHAEGAARAGGLQLLACSGPQGGRRCPALDGQRCPLAAGADVIVVSPARDEARWRDLLAAHADVHPGVPVCVEPSAALASEDVDVAACPVANAPDVVSFVRRLARPVSPNAT